MSPAVEDGRNNDPWPILPWQPDLNPAAGGHLADDDPPCGVPGPPLGPGELRTLLRECVNVVEPGDILIIRVPTDWTLANLRDLGQMVEVWLAHNSDGIRALLVPAEEIKVLHPAPQIQMHEAVAEARRRLTQFRRDLDEDAP